MTTVIVELRTPDGSRTIEVLVAFATEITLAESCIEACADGQREWRDTRSMLLLVGRKPEAAR